MKLSVMGLGVISKAGSVQAIESMLGYPAIDPTVLTSDHTLAVDIPDEFQISPSLVRRMSHFAKISLLSACYALKDSGIDLREKAVGIIQGSVYGPIISGIQAFDDLIDFGDNQLSPTNFSGSVFNTSATYLSLAFGIQGCTLSHTSGLDTLYNSLQSAALWLESGTVDYVIAGIGDEYTPYFDHGTPSYNQQDGLLPSCEGWTTFILGKDDDAKYGKVECKYLQDWPDLKNEKVIVSFWNERVSREDFLHLAVESQACVPLYLRGSYPSAAAFDLALALICGKKRRFPIYQPTTGIYQNIDTTIGEPITCYSQSENTGFYQFQIKDVGR
ncbi:MAG TPA: beta-ketoacyl synthase N-terminal-like domain-containing protein [Bacillota bacterium]|nr:beta-ketoacyl synthase N-terminal-like domain-containing protein [Bacillota bacterium]